MEPKVFIETPRLILREWTDADHEPFIALNQDPDVMEFFQSTATEAETRTQLERIAGHFVKYGFGRFAVERKDNHEFIGFTGAAYATITAGGEPIIEIGWRLSKANWGLGFATEAALACLEYCFEVLQLNEIYSYTAVPNKRSEQVMVKIGMTKQGYFEHLSIPDGHPLKTHVLYKIENKSPVSF